MNMRKTALLLAFLVSALCGKAQDFLTPESFGIYDLYENGDETLFRLLVASEGPEGRSATRMAKYSTYFLCLPSFSPEYALVVGNNQLILNKAKENIWYYLTDLSEIQSPVFQEYDKKQQKQLRSRVESFKSNPIDQYTLTISEEQRNCISSLFEHATLTATHLQSVSLGCDGTTYYFNHSGRLASVWMAQGGRTAQLVHIAQRLCHAVEHQDTAVLNQQMELCRALAKEFKQEYPNRYFQPSWISRSSGDKGPWRCELSGDNCMGLEVLFDTAVSDEALQNVNDLYTDSLAVWSREIFMTCDNPTYPSVTINNHADTATCLSRQTENGLIWRGIVIPTTHWCHDIILSAAQLPPGRYCYLDGQWKKKE